MHIRGKTRARQLGAMATMAGVLATLAFAGSGDASASGPVTPEAGASWSHLSEPGFGAVVTALSIDPHDGNHLLVGGEMDGIFTSRDGGTTFQPALGLHDYEIGEFTWNIAHPNEVWVGTMGGPYVSRDGGGTWTAARVGFPNPEGFCYSAPIEKVAVDPANANHLIAFGGSQRLRRTAAKATGVPSGNRPMVALTGPARAKSSPACSERPVASWPEARQRC